MRISDWSSDVCSSDLATLFSTKPSAATPTSLPSSSSLPARRSISKALASHSSKDIPHDHPHRTPQTHHPRALRRTSDGGGQSGACQWRSEEHTSGLQSLMRISYAVFCLKKQKNPIYRTQHNT